MSPDFRKIQLALLVSLMALRSGWGTETHLSLWIFMNCGTATMTVFYRSIGVATMVMGNISTGMGNLFSALLVLLMALRSC